MYPLTLFYIRRIDHFVLLCLNVSTVHSVGILQGTFCESGNQYAKTTPIYSRMTRIVLLISFIFFFGRFSTRPSVPGSTIRAKKKLSNPTLRRITGTTLAVTFSTFTELTALRCRMLLLFGIIKAADIFHLKFYVFILTDVYPVWLRKNIKLIYML